VTVSTARTERAPIRPFRNIASADLALDTVALLVNGDPEIPGAVVVSSDLLSSCDFALTLPTVEDVRSAVERTGLIVNDCGLVILAAGKSHRGASRILYAAHLNGADYPTTYPLDREPNDLVLSDRAGFSITVAIVLLVDYATHEILRPHMAGTWLARRDFRVTVERDETSFSPEELTEEVRLDNNLPDGVVRFFKYTSVVGADDMSDVVRIYVEPTVLNWLFANEKKPASVQMQTELAVQAYQVAAAAMADEIRASLGGRVPSVTDLEDYPVAERFFDFLTDRVNQYSTSEVSLSDVLDLATTPGLLAAHLEVVFKMRESTLAALREN